MKLGLHLPAAGADTSPDRIADVALAAERAGLGSVWVFERLLRPTYPIPMGGFGDPVPPPEAWSAVYDPLETLSYLAGRTERITLGASVVVALLHNPVLLARRIATLDRLSAGRAIVGVGQGWMPEEYAAAGVPVKRRGAGFTEHLEAMRAVWGPDPVRYDGRFYRVPESEIGPKPVRAGGPSVVVGAATPPAVERAATLGFGLCPVVFDWDVLENTVATFRRTAAEAGHDPDALPLVMQVNGDLTEEPQGERGPLVGSVEQVAEDLERVAGLRPDHVLWAPMGSEAESQLPLLVRVAGQRSA